MRLEFSNRAVADLRQISAKSKTVFGDVVALELEARIGAAIERIAEHPTAAARIEGQEGMWMVPLVRYPFKIFYRVHDDTVRILHIRHTSRRPWTGGS
jgi:toxin ParE1/3/4